MGVALAMASAAVATGEDRTTATVAVTITVLPYADVQLDVDHVEVTLPPGPGDAPAVYVGGTIRTNVPAHVSAQITKPLNAPGDWTAEPQSSELANSGVYRFDTLLKIMVTNLPESFTGATYTVALEGRTGEVQTPGAGVATVTIAPY
ncbi:MAG: hypothetical protein WD042_11820 [Phycisphaeraceae bacterium]